jgi:hypothetical protein
MLLLSMIRYRVLIHAFLLPPCKSPALETLLELHVLLIIIFSTRIVHME